MTDDLSALREEVARALWARDARESGSTLTWDEARAKRHYDYLDDGVIAVQALLRDPVRLVRVLTDQPCAVCGPNGERSVDVKAAYAGHACDGRLDLVALLVENGVLEAVEWTTGGEENAWRYGYVRPGTLFP